MIMPGRQRTFCTRLLHPLRSRTGQASHQALANQGDSQYSQTMYGGMEGFTIEKPLETILHVRMCTATSSHCENWATAACCTCQPGAYSAIHSESCPEPPLQAGTAPSPLT